MNIEQRNLSEDPALGKQALAVARAAEAADGVAPLSEQFLLGISDPRVGHRHIVVFDGDEMVAVAGLEGDTAELVVHPERRRSGVGTMLYRRLRLAHRGLQVWAHGNLPGARALAAQEQLNTVRELLVFQIEEPALRDAAQFSVPEGFQVADLHDSREQFGTDKVDRDWLQANNDAFAWHPEQGGWDLERLARAQEAEWFSDRDVLFLWDTHGERAELAGFHWTKWHTEETPAFGEVYVVGLAAAYRGRGLGGPILQLGLEHLQRRGAEKVILYVEADNEAAVKVYRNAGFTVSEQHTVYAPS
ncbi:mycothiol synthase [Corynebacterium halotolerans]|uniref:mycothiol synthase n=1 Tax=Corynebacterium halotolerans TaxID=225326 RepID=UPI003CF7BEFF